MRTQETIKRRDFLSRTGAAAIGAAAALGYGNTTTSAESGPPFVTGVPGKKLVGSYMYSLDDILDDKYMDALQDKLGVNVILFSPPIKLPKHLLEKNPIGPERTLCARAHTEDDSGVFKAVEAAHARGMDFWLYYTGHHYGEESRSIMSENFDGVKFLDLPRVKYSLENMRTACFAKPIVKEFEPEVFSYGAKTYQPDAMYVSHYRYTNPSWWHDLFGCACPYCQEEAASLGYDFSAMKKAMKRLLVSLRSLDRTTVKHAAETRLTLADFLTMLGDDNAVMDWLYFRAKVVGNQLKRIRGAVHSISNGRTKFISDTHNETCSLYVGHNHAEFIEGASDAFHTLSWCAFQHVSAVAAWANQLCGWVDGLDEPTAIKAVSRFFGWDDLGLPEDRIHKIIGLDSPGGSFNAEKFYAMFNDKLTVRLLRHEWTKLAAFNRGRLPIHPVIKGDVFPERVGRELMDVADDLDLTGYVFQRTDNLIDRDKL